MALTITADEVRYRTVNLAAIDASDTLLASDGFIPAAQHEVNQILSDSSLDYDELDTAPKGLAKAACIALCAQKVVESAPIRGSETGPIKVKPISSADKKAISEQLEREWKRLLERAGCTITHLTITTSGSDDYMPDGEDLTNIDFVDEDSDTFSVWG